MSFLDEVNKSLGTKTTNNNRQAISALDQEAVNKAVASYLNEIKSHIISIAETLDKTTKTITGQTPVILCDRKNERLSYSPGTPGIKLFSYELDYDHGKRLIGRNIIKLSDGFNYVWDQLFIIANMEGILIEKAVLTRKKISPSLLRDDITIQEARSIKPTSQSYDFIQVVPFESVFIEIPFIYNLN